MKQISVLLCLFFSVLTLHARAIQEDYRGADEKARVSYAFGMIMGSNIQTAPLDFDYDAFTEGLRAMLEKNMVPQFTEQEATEIVETVLHKAMEAMNEENRILEQRFLSQNSLRPEIQVTASGLQYEIIEESDGEKPVADSVVRVNYVGTFIDGSPFDSSSGEENGVFIPLNVVIPGWSEGLQLMNEGSVFRLYIPSEIGYGSGGIPSMSGSGYLIPPYSTLIFTVELLEVIEGTSSQEF